jgi:hypothetical protein
MEHLDYLPFLQFIRDDKETVEIMQQALTIIPKVCDFLDGNLQAFNPNTANATPLSITDLGPLPPPLNVNTDQPITSENRLNPPTGNRAGVLSLKRTTSNESVISAAPLVSSRPHGVPPKKARILCGNCTTNRSSEMAPSERAGGAVKPLEEIRQQLQHDYDKFVRQIGELAALEREKNRLLGKFLNVSQMASGSESTSVSETAPSSTPGN